MPVPSRRSSKINSCATPSPDPISWNLPVRVRNQASANRLRLSPRHGSVTTTRSPAYCLCSAAMMLVCCCGGTTRCSSRRGFSLVIIPFLVGAFVILYGFPRDTARLFGLADQAHYDVDDARFGLYRRCLFLRTGGGGAPLGVIKGGFLPVVLFASLLGVATVHALGRLQSPACDVWDLGNAVFHDAVSGVRGVGG